MLEVEIMPDTFKVPDGLDAKAWFQSLYGVRKYDDMKSQQVLLKVYGKQVRYFRSLPLHSSQEEIETHRDHSVFAYNLAPDYDFKQDILSFGDTIEVLEPKTLAGTLKEAGVHLVEKESKRFLDSVEDKSFYNEGVKQMISHYLGVTTELMKGEDCFSGKKVVLGEILFNFGDRVPKAFDKYQSYKDAYSILQKVLARCAEEDGKRLIINNLTTYQSVLGSEANHKFLMNLPESIRQFYRFDEII